ncbi:plakophilin-3a isoform X2 [Trichomycterus rosablanca]|uniref:plakophilin-3a isoform X2 n=1 Tax=Trichomycterus rosablanca TaxID=2290929 RepID=UPI002F35AEC1
MPNSSTVSTYAVPSENQLAHGGTLSDEAARARRVQQQVAQRLAEKSTLPRRPATSSSHYASSDYGGSATMTKYSTYNPSFSSKSYMVSTNRPMMAQRTSQQASSGYSSRSAMDFGTRAQISRGVSPGMMYHEDAMAGMGGVGGMSSMGGGYQGGQTRYQTTMSQMSRPISRGAPDPETLSLHSQRMQTMPQNQFWLTRNGSEGSLGSDQETNFARQEAAYTISNGYATRYPQQAMYSTTGNEFSSGVSQMAMTLPVMRNSFSSSLARNGSGMNMDDEILVRQAYKGVSPSQRTISKITQGRQNRYSVSGGSLQGGAAGGSLQGGAAGGSFVMSGAGSQSNLTMMKGRMSRAPSMRSVVSVGKGKDVFDGVDMTDSMYNLNGIKDLDLATAIRYLESSNITEQSQGAAFIQHECYHNKDSKRKVKEMHGIEPLVRLFNSESQEVQNYATGAARNLIYENMENKVALIEAGGIPKLMEALKEPDDELQKNITGILWNLSSKDNLKEKLARETLPRLTEEILIPLSGTGEREIIEHNSSEADIFLNTTGCLRNLSSINKPTRQKMRETQGLVDALVGYLQKSLEDERVEGKGVENVLCVLRNLSYQLYDEIPKTALQRLEGPSMQSSLRGEPIGCFTPQSKKAKDRQNKDLTTFNEVARVPKGMEWLWHPQVVGLYHQVLKKCDTNPPTREAAAGALQNITAGETRWASILSRVALEQEHMLPTIVDHLKTNSDSELRTLAGFLRNLSRHAKDKGQIAPKVVSHLVSILPTEGNQKFPSPDVVVNICGALNNLVTCSEVAARDIAYFDGLPKLVNIKNFRDASRQNQSKAAATVLSNMYQYKKLQKEYKKKGFQKEDFTDPTF